MANSVFFHGFETGNGTETGVSVALSNTRGLFDTTELPEGIKVNWKYQSQSGINCVFSLESTDPLEVFCPVSTYRVDVSSFNRTVKVDEYLTDINNHPIFGFNMYVPVAYSGDISLDYYPIIVSSEHCTMLLPYDRFARNNHANLVGTIKNMIESYRDGDLRYYSPLLEKHIRTKIIIPIFEDENHEEWYSSGTWWDDEYLMPEKWLEQILWHFSFPISAFTDSFNNSWKTLDDWDDGNTSILSGTQLVTVINNTPTIMRYRWYRNHLVVLRGSEFTDLEQHNQYAGRNLFGDILLSATDNRRGIKTMIKVVSGMDADNPSSISSESLDIMDMILMGKGFRNDFRPLDEDGKIVHPEIAELHPLEPVKRLRRREAAAATSESEEVAE